MATSESATPPARVAIIDDHDVVHAGIEAWCAKAEPAITVVGSFHSPHQYFDRYPALPNDEVDVLIFDLQFDGKRPDWDTLAKLTEAGPAGDRLLLHVHRRSDSDESGHGRCHVSGQVGGSAPFDRCDTFGAHHRTVASVPEWRRP